jgi:hypothetical protein
MPIFRAYVHKKSLHSYALSPATPHFTIFFFFFPNFEIEIAKKNKTKTHCQRSHRCHSHDATQTAAPDDDRDDAARVRGVGRERVAGAVGGGRAVVLGAVDGNEGDNGDQVQLGGGSGSGTVAVAMRQWQGGSGNVAVEREEKKNGRDWSSIEGDTVKKLQGGSGKKWQWQWMGGSGSGRGTQWQWH